MTTGVGPGQHSLPPLKRWATVLSGCNVPEIEKADGVTRWLVITRACVFSARFSSSGSC